MTETPSTSEVRAWARDRGYQVGDRGRLSPTLVAEYLADRKSAGQRRERLARARTVVPALGGRTVRAKSTWDWQRRSAG